MLLIRIFSATPEDKSLAFQAGGEAAQPREEVGLIKGWQIKQSKAALASRSLG